MSLLSPINFSWSLGVFFISNQSDHRVASIPSQSRKVAPQCQGHHPPSKISDFVLFSEIISFRPIPFKFQLVSQVLVMELACSFIQMFSDQFFPNHPTNNWKYFQPFWWKLKTLRHKQNSKYYLGYIRRVSFFRKFIVTHISVK